MLKTTYNSNAYDIWEEKENTWIMLSKLVLSILNKTQKTQAISPLILSIH